jgi:hypothetical protein
MSYIVNPKVKGSGILAAIPHLTECPIGCDDCFFQSGRSYLEPLSANLPNMPEPDMAYNRVVRINDGNDSNIKQDMVISAAQKYPMKFYNTSINRDLEKFDAPVVLTLNPGKETDTDNWHRVMAAPKNLMMVRYRTNAWNFPKLIKVVDYYTNLTADNNAGCRIPVILTFMAYHKKESIPEEYLDFYIERKRTSNAYWAITTDAWDDMMDLYREHMYVYSCGKVEGERGKTSCERCGNCLREYFATMERLRS